MIPQAFITEWSAQVPWQTNEQIEQDLIISRSIVKIFSDDFLSSCLAFRGGTAMHKLFMKPQPRYSEDIDLVLRNATPIGPIIDKLRENLIFLGEPKRIFKENNFKLQYRFESEFQPIQNLRLKIETNCREHFTILGYISMPFEVESSWFRGSCNLITYPIEELLGTKLRALYQRRKGRDLFDLYKALMQIPSLDKNAIIKSYYSYMDFSAGETPSKINFINNLKEKIYEDAFRGDIVALIRPNEKFDFEEAFTLIENELFPLMK